VNARRNEKMQRYVLGKVQTECGTRNAER